jgi:pimeloyl-ACP methyl ester carboxylesterase
MTTKQTGTLDVPGASLYYEIYGAGPTLLMISPGLGDCGFYSQVAEILSDEYLVLTYDRRGNSRSKESDPDAPFSVAEQTDDARRVLEAFGEAPAYVFGGSGGAVVALDFTARHPELVRMAVAHEPPLVQLLPDAAKLSAEFDDIEQTYREQGVYPAMEKFGAAYQDEAPEPDLDPDNAYDPSIEQRLAGNFEVLLGREMLPFTRYTPDLAALKRGGRRIVLGGGEKSGDTNYPYRGGLAVSERLETEFVVFPGDHAGYLARPRPFAAKLRGVLSRR